MTSVSSATPLYHAVVRLTSREWLNVLVGCDVLSEKSVKAVVTGMTPRRPQASRQLAARPRPRGAGPRASRRIDTSSEALRCGASGESENWYLIRGLVVWFWVEPASGEPGYLFEVGRRSSRASDVAGLPAVVF